MVGPEEVQCDANEFKCDDNVCLPNDKKCDGKTFVSINCLLIFMGKTLIHAVF